MEEEQPSLEKKFKINPAYIELGKALGLQLGTVLGAVNPLLGLGAAAAKAIWDTQEAIGRQNDVLARAQFEQWTPDDPRWAAALAEQQERMDIEDRRHDAMR